MQKMSFGWLYASYLYQLPIITDKPYECSETREERRSCTTGSDRCQREREGEGEREGEREGKGEGKGEGEKNKERVEYKKEWVIRKTLFLADKPPVRLVFLILCENRPQQI